MTSSVRHLSLALASTLIAAPAIAQDASFVYRLGKDTLAVEQYTRTPTRFVGEVVSRQGATVVRLAYDVALAADGRPTAVTYRVRNAAGAPVANQPLEVRVTFMGDSAKREAKYADSTNTRMLPAAKATPIANPAYGLYELAFAQMRKGKMATSAITAAGTGAGAPFAITFTAGKGDTIAASTGVVYRADNDGRLLAVDATGTTNKLTGTRGTAKIDIAALAAGMKPIGTLSARGVTHASFLQSVVFVDYGRPQVRDRTVWGGLLVPLDTIWRTGANEATHLATSRELTFGDVVVPPGIYTLWIYNTRTGPQLAINKQIGGWGAGPTSYDQAKDLARIPMTLAATPDHVEEFTINIKQIAQRQGALEFAWGDKAATAMFTVK